MLGATHQEAVRALRSAGDRIQIMVCTGWASGTDSPGLSKSMSSLDREDDEYLRIQQVGQNPVHVTGPRKTYCLSHHHFVVEYVWVCYNRHTSSFIG